MKVLIVGIILVAWVCSFLLRPPRPKSKGFIRDEDLWS